MKMMELTISSDLHLTFYKCVLSPFYLYKLSLHLQLPSSSSPSSFFHIFFSSFHYQHHPPPTPSQPSVPSYSLNTTASATITNHDCNQCKRFELFGRRSVWVWREVQPSGVARKPGAYVEWYPTKSWVVEKCRGGEGIELSGKGTDEGVGGGVEVTKMREGERGNGAGEVVVFETEHEKGGRERDGKGEGPKRRIRLKGTMMEMKEQSWRPVT